MSKIPSLTSLQAFIAVAECKSQQFAAERLCLTPSAVSHKLKKLESFLGIRLIQRSSRGVKLTQQGWEYYAQIKPMVDGIGRVGQAVKSGGENLTLGITCQPDFYECWLKARLPLFQSVAPGVQIAVDCSNHLMDLRESSFDLGIRFGLGDWLSVASMQLSRETLIPVCEPELRTRLNSEDWVRQPESTLLSVHSSINPWEGWFAHHGIERTNPIRENQYMSFGAAWDACLKGEGVLLCPETLCSDAIKNGHLMRLPAFEPWAIEYAFYLVKPVIEQVKPAVGIFSDWIVGQFQVP